MKTITIELNSNGFKDLVKELKSYEKILKAQSQIFVNRLADVGIVVAMQNTGVYSGYITFEKKQESIRNGAKSILIAYGRPITKEWSVDSANGGTETHTETIDPLLMAEFGSGFRADNKWSQEFPFAGQGTLDKYGHAFDFGGWSWKDEDGHWRHSKGEQPTYPMYTAYVQMRQQIEKIAREVFK